MWGEFVVGSHPCSEGFLPGPPVFLSGDGLRASSLGGVGVGRRKGDSPFPPPSPPERVCLQAKVGMAKINLAKDCGGRADGDGLAIPGGRHNMLHRTERGGKVLLQPYVPPETKRIK